nr:MAG TPA: hypothetical protein [Caudoviricetes sp.]
MGGLKSCFFRVRPPVWKSEKAGGPSASSSYQRRLLGRGEGTRGRGHGGFLWKRPVSSLQNRFSS